MASSPLVSSAFEVWGVVQGVFFRKYTSRRAIELGLVGWVKNTDRGTVQGVMEGERKKVETMKIWLRTRGSPQSRIDRVEFSNETDIEALQYEDFSIKK
ncbi:acylphosphatase-1-like protein [Gonapodya prolifera JEL478]|uniref:Acylphosphatase n=1 Tax=Gonapodya prolifera (strain JEL478) TaxID=1344416 RepID=A0A139A9Z5_GONPJ|nr:acylphosphatase-1-like protein [Gonapodya prolifera JEL478]|eukprot:KXS13315.1 acylphosphatase-1-like protein [Gonapodya prolifera JEL478]